MFQWKVFLAGSDGDGKPILRRRDGTIVAIVVGAVGIVRVVEIQEGAVGPRIVYVDVAPGAVRCFAVGQIGEGNEPVHAIAAVLGCVDVQDTLIACDGEREMSDAQHEPRLVFRGGHHDLFRFRLALEHYRNGEALVRRKIRESFKEFDVRSFDWRVGVGEKIFVFLQTILHQLQRVDVGGVDGGRLLFLTGFVAAGRGEQQCAEKKNRECAPTVLQS